MYGQHLGIVVGTSVNRGENVLRLVWVQEHYSSIILRFLFRCILFGASDCTAWGPGSYPQRQSIVLCGNAEESYLVSTTDCATLGTLKVALGGGERELLFRTISMIRNREFDVFRRIN